MPVLRGAGDQPRQTLTRRFIAAFGAGQGLVVLHRQPVRRRAAAEQPLIARDRSRAAALGGEAPRLGQPRRIDRAELQRLLHRADPSILRIAAAQCRQRAAGGAAVATLGGDDRLQRQRVRIGRIGLQRPCERLQRLLGLVLCLPEAGLRQQRLHGGRDGGGHRARRRQERRGLERRRRGACR